jgi:hypothetical protein
MATIYGRSEFGYFTNGNFETGTNTNFTFGTINSSSAYEGNFCLERTGGAGAGYISPQQFQIEVDVSASYQMIAYARTLQTGGTSGTDLAGGHIGFSCYDQFNQFIDLRHCGGLGNTYLTRPLVAGDSHVYIESFSGWMASGSTNFFRHIMLYPPTHPYYSIPHQYTRIGLGDFDLYYGEVTTLSGEIQLQLVNSAGTPITMPNIGYALPSGSAVSNGVAGGTYNYALSNPDYPTTWTRYATPPFTGANRNSTFPFRFGTKYIRFLVLQNHNRRLDAVQNHVWALDNVFFGKVQGGKDYRNSL